MTFSIVLCDPKSKTLGVAVATCHLAVGALVPHLKSGIGAIATQAATNPYLGLKGLEKMTSGYSLKDSLLTALNEDSAKDSRQLHGVDVSGNAWAWTGNDTVEWSGHKYGKNFSLAGNMLVGEQVLEACFEVIKSKKEEPIEERLLQALKAGEDTTGCTVHFVNEYLDSGAIIKQQEVPILPGETVESLTRAIQQAEHYLLPLVINAF